MQRIFALLITLAAAVSLPQAAFSQEEAPAAAEEPAEESADEAAAEEEASVEGPNFGALDIDVLVLGGFGGFLYPHVEPGVDIGLVPLGDDFAISVGAGVDFGWCALCAVIDLVSDLNISSSYYAPQGRVNLHLGTLFDLIPREVESFTLDPYVGVFGGPVFYKFAVKDAQGGASVSAEQVTFLVGPALGIRLGFANNRFLLVGEYRWSNEAGFTTVTVRDENGTSQTINGDDFSRRGNDFILGIGFRI